MTMAESPVHMSCFRVNPRCVIALAGLAALTSLSVLTSSALGDDECCRDLRVEAYVGVESDFAGYDAAGGRDLRNYPPSREADIGHIKIELDIPSMDEPRLLGVATVTFAPLGKALSTLTLDARAMTIKEVSAAGRKCSFGHDGMVLSITVDPPIPVGEAASVVVKYELSDPPEGLLWTGFNESMPTRTPQIHSQGQAETNSYWFPCRDFPNDRATTEVIATVPEGFMASSNGRLVSHKQVVASMSPGAKASAAPQKREVWHWTQDKDHVAYLVTLVVGKFDVVDVGSSALPMPVYVPPGRGKDVVGTYGRTAEMVGVFEKLFDEQYPWDRYAQLVVTNFNSGGMENTSATTMLDSAIIGADNLDDHDLEGLISHELAHQWFGDLLTCNSWEHIWLNEGFATYSTGLWNEHRTPGKDEPAWMSGPLAYERSVRGWFDDIINNDKGVAPAAIGMTSKVYAHPMEAFRKPANPYPKGASILHMLRRRLGDELFFKGIQTHVERGKFKTVETSDLRRVMEEVSGLSLEQFFWQWCTRPGIPRVAIDMKWDAEAKALSIVGKQTQTIDGDNSAFEFTLPIEVVLPDGTAVTSELKFEGKEAAASIACEAEPLFAAVDPDTTILAQHTITPHRPQAFKDQALLGRTHSARVLALRAMATPGPTRLIDELADKAADASTPVAWRLEWFSTAMLPEQPFPTLTFMAADRYELRQAACEKVGDFGAERWKAADPVLREQLAGALRGRVHSDPSLRVRCAAIRAMGKLRDPEFLNFINTALVTESHADSLRLAAIDALVSMNTKDSLHQVATLCDLAHFSRTRGAAIESIPKLASHDKEFAFHLLEKHLSDRILRVQRAAADGLVRLKDPRGIEAFDAAIARERSGAMKRQLERWQGQLERDIIAERSKGVTQASSPKRN
jgi:aminopeptidase N